MASAQFGYYLVALVDVLGQTEQLGAIPKGPFARNEEYHAAASAVGRIAGRVRVFRDLFDTYFEKFQPTDEHVENDELHTEPSGDKYQWAWEGHKSYVTHYGFSDLTVTFVRITQENRYSRSTNGVRATLAGIAGAMTVLLSLGIPVRGGIDIGLGIEPYDGEIYGPVLSSAHCLERKKAEYPRILVGEGLLEFLEFVRQAEGDEAFVQAGRLMAESCLSTLTHDRDGQVIVDYLGEHVRHHVAPHLQSEVRKAFEFVKNEEERWKEIGDEKLTSRYASLLDYFERNRQVWGL